MHAVAYKFVIGGELGGSKRVRSNPPFDLTVPIVKNALLLAWLYALYTQSYYSYSLMTYIAVASLL